MFLKHAASLWQRLVTPRPAARPTTGPDQEDRRVWVRFPARTQAQVRSAGEEVGTLLTAKVLDVSLGGVKLLVGQRFEEGSLISLDLPGGDGPSSVSVLACVVRTEQRPDGEWELGCNFSQEMNAADLQWFGIAKAKPQKPDGRSWSRFDCPVTAFYTDTNTETATRFAAQVANISAGGVALVVDREVPNGTMLSVELFTADTATPVTSILACVVHVSVLPEGGRMLGCNFICELSEAHMNALLFDPARVS